MINTVFSYAFRPFFILVAVYAILSVAGWGLFRLGLIDWPDSLPPHLRHGHEMLFGFAGGAIAGFLLTAVATWTSRPAVSGYPLIGLCVTWVLARIGAFMPGQFGFALWSQASLIFWIVLAVLMAREVIAARNARNYKVLPLLLGFLTVEAAFFVSAPEAVEYMETCLRIGVFLVIGMISLVGGRIIPAFTQNWLRLKRPDLQVQLSPFDRFDLATTLTTASFAVGFSVWPDANATGWLGVLSALTQSLRLARWRGWLAWQEPLLWVLHLGYAWIPIGFGLLGAGTLSGQPLFDGGIHALTYGAMGTLILGVAARVALGHTGRALQAFPSITIAFVLVIVGTSIRIMTSTIGSGWVIVSLALWISAYLIFLLRYLSILLSPRVNA